MRLLPPSILIVLAAGALAACGGGSELSAGDYRAELDTACERLQRQNLTLPQKVRDEQLTLTQASTVAQRYGEEFRETIDALDPPGELSDAHERLLEFGERNPPGGDDVAAFRRWVLELADLYRDLGADGCERAQRAVAEQLPSAAP
jgi:hypothetical protein